MWKVVRNGEIVATFPGTIEGKVEADRLARYLDLYIRNTPVTSKVEWTSMGDEKLPEPWEQPRRTAYIVKISLDGEILEQEFGRWPGVIPGTHRCGDTVVGVSEKSYQSALDKAMCKAASVVRDRAYEQINLA